MHATVESSSSVERAAIEALMIQYVQCANHSAVKEWYELFVEEGIYTAITHENLNNGSGLSLFKDQGKDALTERAAFWLGMWQNARAKTTHCLANISIADLESGSAKALSNFTMYRTNAEGVSEFHCCGEYRDSLVKRDGRWYFQQRQVVVDCQTLPANFTDML